MRPPYLTVLLVTLSVAAACRKTPPEPSPQLQATVAQPTSPFGGVSKDVWADVQKFYGAREQRPAWTDSKGPTVEAAAALDVIRAADAHGLDRATYGEADLTKLQSELAAGDEESPQRPQQLAGFDARLTAALLQLARHVAIGQLKPESVDARWNAKRQPPDYVSALQQAHATGIAGFLDAVRPKHPEYKALQDALAALRGQVTAGWPKIPRANLKVGQWNAPVVVPLRQRLATSGYLSPNAPPNSAHYDADVELAVKTFQEHHGLKPTGTLDSATLSALNVPLDARLNQLAMNMERWRWMPDDLGTRHLLINIPSFHLIAREEGKPVLDIRVVVGKRGNETPIFSDTMETVVFSPYWNVPETIALEETAPAMARDPDYLARNNMEVVNAAGRVVSPDSIPWGNDDALRGFRFRQRPGDGNALGNVKFLFPNRHAVYLHDTPADALFKRIGRAFSHGCVRVEEPETLAAYVLRDQSEWTADAIRSAMRAGTERHVKLPTPIPVHIVYLTSWVDDKGGVHFADDVYGYDGKQQRARPSQTR
jgi:murein L,D-transpeptidase YcbB/YkuD